MKPDTVGEIIASRVLKRTDETGRNTEVRVLLGKPLFVAADDCWYGPYQIIGLGSERVGYSRGVDGFQAIQNAIDMLGADLFYFKQQPGGTLTWSEGESGKLGFAEADSP